MFDPSISDSNAVSLSLVEFSPGAEIARHSHAGSAEILYILSGAGEIHIGSDKLAFGPDQAIHLPENQPHAAKFTGPEKTIALQIYAPAGPEQRFKGGGSPSPAVPKKK